MPKSKRIPKRKRDNIVAGRAKKPKAHYASNPYCHGYYCYMHRLYYDIGKPHALVATKAIFNGHDYYDIGDIVMFGKPNGQKTKAVVLVSNKSYSKSPNLMLELLEDRGITKIKPKGTIFRVAP